MSPGSQHQGQKELHTPGQADVTHRFVPQLDRNFDNYFSQHCREMAGTFLPLVLRCAVFSFYMKFITHSSRVSPGSMYAICC